MKTKSEIESLVARLNRVKADDLESQDLDFKEWDARSMEKAIRTVVMAAVCMANGGGGTVVFGVADKKAGRSDALPGVPPEIDINRLKKAVYDSTDPKLTPVFEELLVPEGTGRLIIMQVYAGMPPYTDASGYGTVRVGKDCQPLTGTMRRKIGVETGESDFTAETVSGDPAQHLSPSAVEALRNAARKEKAPEELVGQSDSELVGSLGLIKNGLLTRAGVLLAGKEESIHHFFPGYVWTYLRMESDTKYTDRADDSVSIIITLQRISERIMADNPISTLEHGFFHFEYRTYPEIAIREALLNALCHADFRLPAPIMIKHYPDRLEISNPGGFIGGISPDNILHHPPVPRNPLLVDALSKLRLVNRSNLGICRMYEAMLMEGKEPPLIQEKGDSVIVTFFRRDISGSFRIFVADESRSGRSLSVDQLLVLQYLQHHAELETSEVAHICQRDEKEIREKLSSMEHLGYIERGGTGKGTYWTLSDMVVEKISREPGEQTKRIDWEVAKTRVLSILKQRAVKDKGGLSNSDVRKLTRYDRMQVTRLIHELENEGHVRMKGHGRGALYHFVSALQSK